jgi:alpha-amylase
MTPKKDYEFIFSKYSAILNGELKGNTVLNYLLMMTVVPLTPNEPKLLKQVQNFYFLRIAQVFYGDESARSLVVEGTQGDAPYVRL